MWLTTHQANSKGKYGSIRGRQVARLWSIVTGIVTYPKFTRLSNTLTTVPYRCRAYLVLLVTGSIRLIFLLQLKDIDFCRDGWYLECNITRYGYALDTSWSPRQTPTGGIRRSPEERRTRSCVWRLELASILRRCVSRDVAPVRFAGYTL